MFGNVVYIHKRICKVNNFFARQLFIADFYMLYDMYTS